MMQVKTLTSWDCQKLLWTDSTIEDNKDNVKVKKDLQVNANALRMYSDNIYHMWAKQSILMNRRCQQL